MFVSISVLPIFRTSAPPTPQELTKKLRNEGKTFREIDLIFGLFYQDCPKCFKTANGRRKSRSEEENQCAS